MAKLLNHSLSSGAKLIVLAIVAVLLPTTILSFVQYRSLIDLENKTKAAAQENLRQILQAISRKAKEDFQSLARQSLGSIEVKEFRHDNLGQIERHFATVKRLQPEIDSLFVVSHCACRGKKFALFYAAEGVRRIDDARFKSSPEVEQTLQEYFRALSARSPADPTQDLLFGQFSCAIFPGETTEQLPVSVFNPLSDQTGEAPFGFAGISIDSGFIEREYLPQAVPELLGNSDIAAKDSELALGIFDENNREIYSNGTNKKGYEVKMPFGPVFPKWQLAIGYKDTTIEALARDSFKSSLMLTLVVLSLLIAGIVLILRATAREMKLAQAKSAFVSNVSHELKTPLALIRLFGETLELGRVKSPEKAEEYYRIITGESRRLTQLINNILDFSKIEAGRKEYQFIECDIAEVVEDVLRTYKYQLINAGFELSEDIEHDLPPALIDRDAISQAVLNLLDNAVKYSTDVKKVAVRVLARERHIAIEVADSGIGIPRSEQKKIFEKFYRVSTGLVHDTKGSGLGLAVVKHIVDAHRGQILVESHPQKGSCFTILIPARRAEAAIKSRSPGAGDFRVAESPNN